jgi:TPR repeat protein
MPDRCNAHENLPDARWEAAHAHADGHAVVDRITGIRRQLLHEQGYEGFMRRQDANNFADGYEYAMKQGYAELITENMELHQRLIEIELEAQKVDRIKQSPFPSTEEEK